MFELHQLTVVFSLLVLVGNTTAAKSRRNAAQIEACNRDPSLSFCRDLRTTQGRDADDKKACSSLENEYKEKCSEQGRRRDEFCAAYENVCFHNKNRDDSDPSRDEQQPEEGSVENTDQPTKTRRGDNPRPTSPKDYIEFCKNYKQRFLYVCPDPVRFGSRAAVFCPIYSERCQLALPEKPVLPAAMMVNNNNNNAGPVQRLCGQYRNFAVSYCSNPLALQYTNVRDNCDKYQRFCSNGQNTFRQPVVMMG